MNATVRRDLWELDPDCHGTIVGCSWTAAELRRLTDKMERASGGHWSVDQVGQPSIIQQAAGAAEPLADQRSRAVPEQTRHVRMAKAGQAPCQQAAEQAGTGDADASRHRGRRRPVQRVRHHAAGWAGWIGT